jgi:hypothetical protein
MAAQIALRAHLLHDGFEVLRFDCVRAASRLMKRSVASVAVICVSTSSLLSMPTRGLSIWPHLYGVSNYWELREKVLTFMVVTKLERWLFRKYSVQWSRRVSGLRELFLPVSSPSPGQCPRRPDKCSLQHQKLRG